MCPWGKCPGGTCQGGFCPVTVKIMASQLVGRQDINGMSKDGDNVRGRKWTEGLVESSDHVRGGHKGWQSYQIMLGVDRRVGGVIRPCYGWREGRVESSDHVRGGQKGWWSHQIMLGVDTRAVVVSWAYLHSLEAYQLKIRSACPN